MQLYMKLMIDLFLTFFKIGITTFGGGYAMIPILTREVYENKNWATEDELLEYYAIGQATPGIIAVNTATFVGYKVGGVIGGIVATLGFITPSIIIISIIFNLIDILDERFLMASTLVKITAIALIFHTVFNMAKKQLSTVKAVILLIVSTALAMMGVSLPLIVIGASIVSCIGVKLNA